MIAALRAAGIDDKDIQTARLSLQPTYETPCACGRARITGFQASNQVTIRLRDVTKIADIIDRAVSAGATDVGGIEFIVLGIFSGARQGARCGGSRRTAQGRDFAKATGTKLGRVLALSEDRAIRGADDDAGACCGSRQSCRASAHCGSS